MPVSPAIRQRAAASLDPFSGEETGRDWSNPDLLGIAGIFAPATSSEPVEAGRNAVITPASFYAVPGSDVNAHDRLDIGGQIWDVVGDPSVWVHPNGWNAGVAITLQRVEG